MADIVVTATAVQPVFGRSDVRSYIAAAAIPGGSAVYFNSSGKVDLTAGGATSTSNFAGIAISRLNTGFAAGIGQVCEVVRRGEVEGFTLSQAYGAKLYVSNTAGALADAAGTHGPGPVAEVVPTSEYDSSGNLKKVVFVNAPFWTAST